MPIESTATLAAPQGRRTQYQRRIRLHVPIVDEQGRIFPNVRTAARGNPHFSESAAYRGLRSGRGPLRYATADEAATFAAWFVAAE